MWPLGWGQFWPQGYKLNNFGNGPLGEATYQISKTWAFWFQTRRFLNVFPIKVYVKHVTLGRGHFWPQGYNFNNLGRGPLDKAVYLISKAWAFCFKQEDFKGFSL